MFSQYIYDKSPYFIQSKLFKLHCSVLYKKRYGHKFDRAISHLDETQWYSHEEILEYQNEKLKILIKHAFDTVPYYNELMKKNKLTPKDITKIEHLPKLPILTREAVFKNKNKLLSNKYRKDQLLHGHTSGTTGSPLDFFWDKNLWFLNNVFDWRQKIWAGVNIGDPFGILLGRPIVSINRKIPPFWQYNPYENQLWISSFHLSNRNFPYILEKMINFKPLAMEGYPSTLYVFTSFLKKFQQFLPLKACFTSSETLYDHQKSVIEEIFHCKNFDFYGMAERVIWATECENQKGKHLNFEYGITEILDENDDIVDTGKPGFLVGTSLLNFGMPFIRYKTTDISSLLLDPCNCGRQMQLISNVTTKAEDLIFTPDGNYISSSILTHPFKPLHNIFMSQIIQKEIDFILIKIIKRDGYSKKDTDMLLSEFSKRVGSKINIKVEFVDNIQREKSGKLKWIKSEIKKDLNLFKFINE